MEIKKSEKANLENKKLFFVEIGLIISLLIVYIALEWTTKETNTAVLEDNTEILVEEEIISTNMETPPPPPAAPKIPVLSDQIDIVDDEIELEDDMFMNLEDNANLGVEIMDYVEVQEEVVEEEAIPFQLVEEKPSFQGGDANQFSKWVNSRLVYPEIAKENGVQGRVTLQFTVEKDGSVTKVRVPGKRSGAYSWGCHTTLPYMLLNFMGTRNDVFTLAHEMGHSMHSYYSSQNQPIAKSSYEIFVAEIASTVNETLLLKYLLKDADKKTRRELLGYRLDMFKSTVFRQTLFAEFEKQAHEVVEKGGALSAGSLCGMYQKLNEEYYGKGYCTPYIKYEWARIPHFYTAYYVYKYATGLISATVIAEDIFNGKEGAVENYKKFLSAGGSMPPLEILKLTGVDLTTSAPFEQAMQVFKDTLKEFKKAK